MGHDTSNFLSNVFVLTGRSPTVRGRTQFWITFDQMLVASRFAPDRGLALLAAHAHDDPDNSLFQHFVRIGALYSGFWHARRNDQIALAFTHYQVSPILSQKESLEQQFGLTPTYAFGGQGHGMVLEANYNIAVYHGIQLQPEIEYFFRPGGVSSVHDALVLGLKDSCAVLNLCSVRSGRRPQQLLSRAQKAP